MKLKSDMDHRLYVETRIGDIQLEDLVRQAIERDGRTMSRLELDCGFVHPRLAVMNTPSGRKPGDVTLLIALMELGYEITVRKASQSGTADL
jgi:hypothetical protein